MDLAQHPQAAKLSVADRQLASWFRTVHIVKDKVLQVRIATRT